MLEKNDNTKSTFILVIGALFLVDKIFGKTDDEKKAEKELKELEDKPQTENPTLGGYKVPPEKKGFIRIRKNIGGILGPAATNIRKAFGNFIYISQNDANTIIDSIKRGRTKPEINVLWQTYSTLFKRDLTSDIKNYLVASNSSEIWKYINDAPEYLKP